MRKFYKISWLLVALALVAACNRSRGGDDLNNAIEWNTYSSLKNYTDPEIREMLNSLGLQEQCKVEVSLMFPSTTSDKHNTLVSQLRKFVLDRFVVENDSVPFNYLGEPQAFVDSLVMYELESFQDELKDIRDMVEEESHMPISAMIKEYYLKDTLLYNANGIISIGLSSYEFNGGAHGISLFTARSYDLRNNNPITPSTLFQDPSSPAILAAIEKQLLQEYEVEDLKQLQEKTGIFSLTGSEVVMSQEIYFTPEGITFYYNPYEIAPFSEGATEVTVPYTIMAPFFRSPYQFLGKL